MEPKGQFFFEKCDVIRVATGLQVQNIQKADNGMDWADPTNYRRQFSPKGPPRAELVADSDAHSDSHRNFPCFPSSDVCSKAPSKRQGCIRMTVHWSRRGSPPPLSDEKDHRRKKRNFQYGKFCQAIFGTQFFASQTPPPP